MIKLDLLVVVNDSMQGCEAGLCSDVINWGAQIMTELSNIQGGTVFWIKYPDHPNVQELAIAQSPTLVFIDSDTKKSITRLTSSQINRSNYQQILRELNTAQPLEDTGDFSTESGFTFGLSGESGFGLNPFGFNWFNFDLPPVAYLIGAILTGYKTVDTPSPIGRVVFGSATAYLGYMYYKKKNS